MDYSLSKHKQIRDAIVAELAGLTTELPGGIHNARVKSFANDEGAFPAAVIFTGADSATYTEDEANLNRDYDVDVVVISRGYDVADIESGQDSFIDLADRAAAAIENRLTKFRFTLDGLIYRLKYLRSVPNIDDTNELFEHVRVMSYTAESKETTTGADV